MHPDRRRAPALPMDERRQALVHATLQLLHEGGAVTTSRIARAAQVAEGTVFRVFPDKVALLRACVEVAARPDAELAALEAAAADAPVRDRLITLTRAAGEHLELFAAALQAFVAAGGAPPPPPGEGSADTGGPGAPEMARLRDGVAAVLAREQDALRVDATQAASVLLGLIFGTRVQVRTWGGPPIEPEVLVDLFLSGACRCAPETAAQPAGRPSTRPVPAPRRQQ